MFESFLWERLQSMTEKVEWRGITPEKRAVQVADLLAYNADDVREVISKGRTFDYARRFS